MAFKGFKRLTVRILDGAGTPTLGTNLFVIEGKTGKGATRTAKLTGLSSDPVKSYGSNVAYHVSNRGVGDVKLDVTAIDLPREMLVKILGHKAKGKIISVGADTEPPYCSVMLETSTPSGNIAYVGLYKGQFSMDAEEFETLKDKQEELSDDILSFSAIASDDTATEGEYYTYVVGPDESELKTFKGALKMDAAG